MRTLLIAVACMLHTCAVHAQTCTMLGPFPLTFIGAPGQQIVPDPTLQPTENLVPAGYFHVVIDASIGNPPGGSSGYPIEASIVKQHKFADGTWHEEGWLNTSSPRLVTPILAMVGTRSALLFPGERLAARSGNLGPGTLYVMYYDIVYPLACLPRWLGMEAPASGGGALTFPPQTITLSGTVTPVP